MKCIDCKNLTRAIDADGDAFFWCEKISDCPYEDMERDCRHFIRKTNADRIRAMTDEDLAEYINDVHYLLDEQPGMCDVCYHESVHNCKKCRLDWLRQETTDA